MRNRIALLGALCACLVLVGGAGAVGGGGGSISLTAAGTAYTQDFDTLAVTGTTNALTINGWFLNEEGSSTSNNGQYRADSGTGNAGDTYSYGATASPERAFGTLFSGTLTPSIGAQFTNNTGDTIAQLAISYTGEQWRFGATGRAADRLDFQVSTNATSLTTGTWTNVDALDFTSPVNSGTVGGLNGNTNSSALGATFPLSVAAGATFWIRWLDGDAAPGADDGLAVDTFSLTPIADDLPPSVQSTTPANGATGIANTSNISVTFTEPVNATGSSFTIACASSGSHTATVSGGPTTFTLDPDTDLGFSELCTVTVLAANVTDQDANDPPDNMEANYVFSFTTDEAFFCGDPATAIHTVQGSGAASPIAGSTVQVEGVVVGDFQGAGQLSGFFLQEEDADADADPATSEGIFVFSSSPVSAGETVRVRGRVTEFNGLTELTNVNAVSVCSTGNALPAVTDATLPSDLERYEGMRVRLPQSLVISEYFNYDRFGELVLALPLAGESRPFTGTAIDEPGVDANSRTAANFARRITLDDGLSTQNPSTLRHPNGAAFSLANRFRGGDTVQNAIGVLDFLAGVYRIQPTGPADYTSTNPRPAAPEPVGGSVRAAAMNTLNFFVTADYPSGNPLDNKCGPSQNVECRGWDSDQPDEFNRQRDKLLQALSGLDADVLGLNELENTTGVEPLQSIVSGLPGYAYINTGTIGTDAIKVGLIYKPAKVTPIGDFKLLTSAVDPRFIDTKSRPVLAQTFEVNATGARFTVAVNHLKSKGSDCNDVGDPDLGDGQGNCSQTRKAAAEALVDWLATDPTGSGDPDFLIVGDLNSYAQEESIDAIKAGSDDAAGTADDYTNLVDQFIGTYAYSYVFDGQSGYLDHALSSASLTGQVTGITEWHINADEPDVLDYDTSFKPPAQDALYEVNAFRTSDHDPILVGLGLATTYDDLCRLTRSYVTKTDVEDGLCDKLAAAKAADAAGNAQAKAGPLNAYVNQVRAQTGKSLTAAQAETLIALAGQL